MHKRAHSREFKLEVVRQAATGQKRPAQIFGESLTYSFHLWML
jgi:transposase-like protein